MNPLFQALTGAVSPAQNGMGHVPPMMANTPVGAIMSRAQQLAGMFQNPQQMVRQFFPDAPANVAGDPEQLLNWMQQTGKVNPQMVQMARQMAGR